MAETSMVVSKPTEQDPNASNFRFTIESAADCFNFYCDGPSGVSYVVQLTGPDGHKVPVEKYRDYYSNLLKSAKRGSAKGYAIARKDGIIAFPTPIAADVASGLAGDWTGSKIDYMQVTQPYITIVQRVRDTGAQISAYRLNVKLCIYANENRKALQKFVEDAKPTISKILKQADIQCDFGNSVAVYDLPADGISIHFETDPNTIDAVARNAAPDAISVIFVWNLKTDSVQQEPSEIPRFVAGISGGIPGPQGFVDKRSAILINFNGETSNPNNLEAARLGLTVAHEIGHYLGLTHWPREGEHAASGKDANNLMYFSGSKDHSGRLEESQIFIIRHQPIVGLVYTDRELLETDKTLVTDLQVTITTGTRALFGRTPGNENMRLAFGLGSDDSGYQTWQLADFDNTDFHPGTKTTFVLDNLETLFMEDLQTLQLFPTWRDPTSYPLSFLTSTDYWDLSHVTIVANGTVIADVAIDTILSAIGQRTYQRKFGA